MPGTFEKSVQDLHAFFQRAVCRRGIAPIRKGVAIAVYLDGQGPATLGKNEEGAYVTAESPANPDMTFHVPRGAVDRLLAVQTEDVGDIGVEILKLMASQDLQLRIQAKVHIGPFDLLRNGYLGVLPLGGPTVMKFLASKGFTGVGKIKDAISRLRT